MPFQVLAAYRIKLIHLNLFYEQIYQCCLTIYSVFIDGTILNESEMAWQETSLIMNNKFRINKFILWQITHYTITVKK